MQNEECRMQNYNSDKRFCILHSTFIIQQMMNNQRLTQTQRQESNPAAGIETFAAADPANEAVATAIN